MDAWLTMRVDELPADEAKVILVVLGALGALYCFLGYRLFKLILGLTGFLLAGSVAGTGAGWLSQGHVVVMAVAMLIGGLCGAMALFFLYKTGVFCVGFLGALTVAHHVLQGRAETWIPWAVLGAAVAGGLLALLLERPAMTLATAAIGSWMIFFAGSFFMMGTGFGEQLTAPENETPVDLGLLAGWAGLALVGAMFQFFAGKKGRREAVRGD